MSLNKKSLSKAALVCMALLYLGAAIVIGAEERFPRPDLGPEYSQPVAPGPNPRARTMVWIDIAALIAALAAAAYFSLRSRSRKGIFWLTIICLGYFGFYRKGCVCPIGAIQNVTLGIFDPSYPLPMMYTAFFFLPLITALFYGRAFCAAVCPLGAIQDVVILKPYRVPASLELGLGMMRHVYLGAAVLFAATGSAFIICDYDPFIAMFRVTGEFNMLVFGACFLGVGMFIGRPYCRYLCPYGVLLGWMSQLSKSRITITPTDCVLCNMCEEVACPFEAITPPSADTVTLDRFRGKRGLASLLITLPILLTLGGYLGYKASGRLSRMNPRVQLLDAINQTALNKPKQVPDTVLAFRGSGEPLDSLKKDVTQILHQFAIGSTLFFMFIAMVILGKLINLWTRRKQEYYEADRDTCLSCARCYAYCPVEREEQAQPIQLKHACQV